jgi:hypothetical protein
MVKNATAAVADLNMEEVISKIYKLRPLMEAEYGSRRETTKLIEGLVSDIKKDGFGYTVHQLRAMAFLCKSSELKKELETIANQK